MPKKIQNLFLERARISRFYNTGFQMRQFQDGFSKISFDREGFQKLKTEKKQIKCYKKDLIS